MEQINGKLKFWMDIEDFHARLQGHSIATVKVDLPFMRTTELPMTQIALVFGGAGMGDFICWMPAVLWLHRNCPWLAGRIFVPKYFMEFAENIMRDTGWPVQDSSNLTEWSKKNRGVFFRGAVTLAKDGHAVPTYQTPNATGGSLVHCGFIFFANIFPPPEKSDELMPEIDFTFKKKKLTLPVESGKYVCFTPGSTATTRTVPGHYWKPIIEYVKSLGYTPVYLGKKEPAIHLKIKFADLDYNDGIDLRDKTGLIQAAWIMKHAAFTVGLDNGLIHLGACTDADLVCGYNIVNPQDRRPHRKNGKWAECAVTRKDIECAGCQSNIKSLRGHDFADCLWGDVRCIDILFEKSGIRWIKAINSILS